MYPGLERFLKAAFAHFLRPKDTILTHEAQNAGTPVVNLCDEFFKSSTRPFHRICEQH